MGDTEQKTEEWAKRINCAVEGITYKGGKIMLLFINVEMPQKRKLLVLLNPFSGAG